MSINWILLIVGGLFETDFAVSLGKAQQISGKEFWFWLASFAICVSISMFLLFKAMGGERELFHWEPLMPFGERSARLEL